MPSRTTRNRDGSGRASQRKQNVFTLLKEDHDKVKKLFQEFEKTHERDPESEKLGELAREICMELTVHARLEEEIFYPALHDSMEDTDLLDEAEVEHNSAKSLIAEIEELGPDDDLFAARVIVLGEYVNHHISEEQNEIFPAARKAGVDAAALGEAIAARKADMQDEIATEGAAAQGAEDRYAGGQKSDEEEEDSEEEETGVVRQRRHADEDRTDGSRQRER